MRLANAGPIIGVMSDAEDRSAHSVARGVVGFLAAVILINVLVRLVPLPDVDLPTSFPDLPGWLDAALKARRWVKIAAIVLAVAVWVAADRLARRRTSGAP